MALFADFSLRTNSKCQDYDGDEYRYTNQIYRLGREFRDQERSMKTPLISLITPRLSTHFVIQVKTKQQTDAFDVAEVVK